MLKYPYQTGTNQPTVAGLNDVSFTCGAQQQDLKCILENSHVKSLLKSSILIYLTVLSLLSCYKFTQTCTLLFWIWNTYLCCYSTPPILINDNGSCAFCATTTICITYFIFRIGNHNYPCNHYHKYTSHILVYTHLNS